MRTALSPSAERFDSFGQRTQVASIAVPSPTQFAETVLREALLAEGISSKPSASTAQTDFTSLRKFYVAENELVDHVSLPLAEKLKSPLKSAKISMQE